MNKPEVKDFIELGKNVTLPQLQEYCKALEQYCKELEAFKDLCVYQDETITSLLKQASALKDKIWNLEAELVRIRNVLEETIGDINKELKDD